MGVGRSSIKITHGRLSSRHLCQLPSPALEGAWVKVEEIIGRGGAATRRSKSLLYNRSYSISVLSTDHAPLAVLGRVTSVELALLAVLYVPTITLTPNPMPYDPKNGNIPASVWRERTSPTESRSHYLGERDAVENSSRKAA